MVNFGKEEEINGMNALSNEIVNMNIDFKSKMQGKNKGINPIPCPQIVFLEGKEHTVINSALLIVCNNYSGDIPVGIGRLYNGRHVECELSRNGISKVYYGVSNDYFDKCLKSKLFGRHTNKIYDKYIKFCEEVFGSAGYEEYDDDVNEEYINTIKRVLLEKLLK